MGPHGAFTRGQFASRVVGHLFRSEKQIFVEPTFRNVPVPLLVKLARSQGVAGMALLSNLITEHYLVAYRASARPPGAKPWRRPANPLKRLRSISETAKDSPPIALSPCEDPLEAASASFQQ
jgi:hypothetical protein